LVVKKNDVAIIGAKTNSVMINNEPVDITSKSSAGFRELLDDPSVRSVDLNISGVWDSAGALETPALTGTAMLSDITIEISDGNTISGDFYLNSFEVTGEHSGAIEFTATLQSSGTFTAA
jgi:predicted secreted protein